MGPPPPPPLESKSHLLSGFSSLCLARANHRINLSHLLSGQMYSSCFPNALKQTKKTKRLSSSALQFSFQASLSCFSCFSFVFFPNVDEQKRSVLSRRTPTPSSRREVFSLLLGSWKKIGISHSRRRRRQRKNL